MPNEPTQSRRQFFKKRTIREALEIAQGLWGALAAVREMRAVGTRVRVCEVGVMPNVPEFWTQPMIVKGAGSSWDKAFAAAGHDLGRDLPVED